MDLPIDDWPASETEDQQEERRQRQLDEDWERKEGGWRARLDEDWEAGELEDEDERGVAAGAPCTTSNTGSTPPPTRRQYHVGGTAALQCAGTALRTVCVGSCWGAAPSISYLLLADYVDINATYASAHIFRHTYVSMVTASVLHHCFSFVTIQ